MKTRTQKKAINRALKMAIVGSRFRTSRAVAVRAGLGEVRLSAIVSGSSRPPTDDEKRAIAKALGLPKSALFAEDVEAVAL